MGHRILIVDDSQITVDVVKIILTDSCYEVRAAGNGKEAIDLVRSFDPDLILLDVRMPVMGGYEFMRALRAMKVIEGKPLPVVIVVTAVENMKEIFRLEGVRSYLVKPVEAAALIKEVEESLAAGCPPAGPAGLSS